MLLRALLTTLTFISLATSASAAATWTPKQLRENYDTCLRFLHASPQKQTAVCHKTGCVPAKIVAGCRDLTSVSLSDLLRALDERNHPDRYRPTRPERPSPRQPSSPSRPAEPPRSGLSTSGTCYSISSCAGNATHVNLKAFCPAGSSAFRPDYGSSACEPM